MKDTRKVVLIGTGMVGMSMAYSLMNTGGVDELLLIDMNEEKAQGEVMDLNDGLPYSFTKMKIKVGQYKDCKDSDIIVICAGANQKEGQTRLELTKVNAKIMKDIALKIKKSGFKGIIIVASNPVDLMSYVVYKVTGFDSSRVIGTGTILDAARMRYLLSEYLNISSDDIEAYILGEHGDSSFISWTNTYIGCKKLIEYIEDHNLDMIDLNDIYEEVKNKAYEIIDRKQATYYGIGLALNKLIQSIFDDAHKILCVSGYLDGEYGMSGLYIGMPCVIGRNGIIEKIKIPLNEMDQNKLEKSYQILQETKRQIKNDILS